MTRSYSKKSFASMAELGLLATLAVCFVLPWHVAHDRLGYQGELIETGRVFRCNGVTHDQTHGVLVTLAMLSVLTLWVTHSRHWALTTLQALTALSALFFALVMSLWVRHNYSRYEVIYPPEFIFLASFALLAALVTVRWAIDTFGHLRRKWHIVIRTRAH